MSHHPSFRRLFTISLLSAVLASLGGAALLAAETVDFQQQIRPILSRACFQCHGPDETHREADLRLDRQATIEGLADKLSQRIESTDADEQMPPPDSGKELTPAEIKLLQRWIDEGANWSEHWAFVAPKKTPLPAPSQYKAWREHPIDRFVAARMLEAGLEPSTAADPATLVRRLYFDLIGLPPSIKDADLFINDPSDARYLEIVQSLLSSQHHGEKWARHWLDAARYADSDGFEKDKPRLVWMYRDWVVDALNRDLPYDQFVVEQIAGDLLPSPTQDQLVATGFLRNSMINEEGGIDPEQFRMEAMFDRMNAIGTAVLGLTIQCAQCHSHKYDPLTQTEYYELFAFINNSHEGSLPVFPRDQLAERKRLFEKIRSAEAKLKMQNPQWEQQLATWIESVRDDQPSWATLEIHNANDNSQRYLPQTDGSLVAAGYAPTRFDAQFTANSELKQVAAFRLELLTDPNLPSGGPGRSVHGLFALTEFQVEVTGTDRKKQPLKFSRASADFANEELTLGGKFADKQGKRRKTGPIQFAIDGAEETAWGIDAGPGRCNVPRKAVFVLESPVELTTESELRFHLVQKHGGWNSDDNQTMNLGRFRISAVAEQDVSADPLPDAVRKLVQSGRALGEYSTAEVQTMFSYWRTTVEPWGESNAAIEALWQQHPKGTTQLVMNERSERRATHRLERGDFLKPLDDVQPAVPEFLHKMHDVDSANRLDFAKWLVDRQSPTAARTIVNRVWQSYFGIGLVETSEDLGSQGATPSHAGLLDWLSVEFMENGWSLKWLHRQIVTSNTYRQSSRATKTKLTSDSMNRNLSRFPRTRLDAELVRDATLAASGLLDRRMGGPGVYPPAPAYLFLPPASYGPKTWSETSSEDRFRRALYTFRFRSVPYPALAVFDAPNADTACARRARSNTPLQALTTLNEPLFVESARALADRTLNEGGATDQTKLTYAFRRCLTRTPTARELTVLSDMLRDVRVQFSGDDGQTKARALVAQSTQAKGPSKKDAPAPAIPVIDSQSADAQTSERAAWMSVCRVILNLDEMISKE